LENKMTIKVFYRDEMNATTKSPSPSPSKPAKVVEDWLANGYIERRDIHSFQPVERRDLYMAHSKEYVDGVLDRKLKNGFSNKDKAVADSLPYTTGSMVAAAICAMRDQTFVCSPTSGFHHAGYSFGGGFCTFNGLMSRPLASSIAITTTATAPMTSSTSLGLGTGSSIRRLLVVTISRRERGCPRRLMP
jgi:acetoin utilization deacetylase AcuC-like enzyme